VIVYGRRLQAFMMVCLALLAACAARLAYLQTAEHESSLRAIEELRIRPPRQLPTVRGTIYDRNGRALAIDRPAFFLHVNYELTRLLDDRFWQAGIEQLRARQPDMNREQAELAFRRAHQEALTDLLQTMDACAQLTGTDPEEIDRRVRRINEDVWRLARYIAAWRRRAAGGGADSSLQTVEVGLTEVLAADIREMHEDYPLVELDTDSALLEAQLELERIEGVSIQPRAKRDYPYGSAACQIIGWVGPAEPQSENELFDKDEHSHYLAGEVSGKEGVERVCEVILRGRRGEITYNLDGELVEHKETLFGQDVRLSLDVNLQQRLEAILSDPNTNPNADRGIGAVVLDVATGDILAMVSVPTFDLRTVRRDYGALLNDPNRFPNRPLLNKALAAEYPPGSTAKPFILVAGLEENKISPWTVISCPFEDQQAKYGFPNCLLFRLGGCHDWRWANEGGNHARNAIRGSCNVYFSRLAERIDERALQRWLFRFGFGRDILPGPAFDQYLGDLDRTEGVDRNLHQATGQIGRSRPTPPVRRFEDLPPIPTSLTTERRYMGIGQGLFTASVLQGANAIAALARGGIYKPPRLFLSDADPHNDAGRTDLGLSKTTLETVRDGMEAVVHKSGGTAHTAFQQSVLNKDDRGLKLFGKTGSTQRPECAWYAGWAEDSTGRAVALAIVVEGGQSGAHDAAPLGFAMIQACNEAGYVGRKPAD